MNGDDGPIRPKRHRPQDKIENTNRVASEILNAETAKREAKTERLRLARLAKEAAEPAQMYKAAGKKRH
jgi:hypothetical protein